MQALESAKEAVRLMKSDVCALLDINPDSVQVVIDDCPHRAVVDYDTRTLHINAGWIAEEVQRKHPMEIRSLIAYYLYGLQQFAKDGVKMPDYFASLFEIMQFSPEEQQLSRVGKGFSLALAALKGVPFHDEEFGFGLTEQIPTIIKDYLGIDTKFLRAATGPGEFVQMLAPAGDYRKRLDAQMQAAEEADKAEWRKSRDERIGIDGMGTKEKPFADINQAFDAILALERETVASDPFLNSDFIRSPFPPAYLRAIGVEPDWGYSYNVTWGLSQVAHLDNQFPDSDFIFSGLTPNPDVSRWLSIFEARNPKFTQLFCLKPNLKHRMFLFRGQYKDFGKCVPNLHRDGVKLTIADELMNTELQCVVVNHPLSRFLGIEGVELFNEPLRFQLNLKGLSQHYYNKTSCLDLTSDVEAAKFFAVTNMKQDEVTGKDKCFVYEPVNPDEPGVIYFYVLRQPSAFQPYGNNFRLSPMGKQYMFGRSAQQHGFLLDIPIGSDFMDSPYAHAVYFRHNAKISQEIFDRSLQGTRYYPAEDLLRDFWKQLQAEWSLPKFRTISKKTFEYYSYLQSLDDIDHGRRPTTPENRRRRLAANRIKVGENRYPRFPREALRSFFQNMDNGWWEDEFCADIHIFGDEGVFMERALRELPATHRWRDFAARYRRDYRV